MNKLKMNFFEIKNDFSLKTNFKFFCNRQIWEIPEIYGTYRQFQVGP